MHLGTEDPGDVLRVGEIDGKPIDTFMGSKFPGMKMTVKDSNGVEYIIRKSFGEILDETEWAFSQTAEEVATKQRQAIADTLRKQAEDLLAQATSIEQTH
jgi:hypothetical protein